MRLADLDNRRIAILGAGREGQAAYHWLRSNVQCGALTIFAESSADPGFAESLKQDDHLFVEPLSAARLRSFDVLIRSPGISPYRKPLLEAQNAGVHITTPSR